LNQTNEKINSEFRLWITTYPIEEFPTTVLADSVKITNEAPTGIRSSLIQSFTNEPISNKEFFDSIKANKIIVYIFDF
jgi:dynein heavy chain